MRAATGLALIALTGALAGAAGADVLQTRDGQTFEGVYRGGTERAIRFEAAGQIQVVPLADVRALTFSGRSLPTPGAPTSAATAGVPESSPAAPATARAPEASPAAPTAASAPEAAPATGTARVAGDRFGGALETGLAAGETPLLPVGTRVYGRIAEVRSTGPVTSRLRLELDQIMFQGQLVPIVSGPQQIPAGAPGPAKASPPERPGFAVGTLLEFRLLQPVELRLP
jgi:hypothetical protein